MKLSTKLPLAFAAGVALLLAAALYGIAVAQSRHRQAATQMDEVMQQNAALVSQASAAAQSLQSQAGNLVQAVSLFRLEPRHVRPAAALAW